MQIGARYLGDGKCIFMVWAPFAKTVNLKIMYPNEAIIPMQIDGMGYWHATTDRIYPETLYFYNLNDSIDRPDPASFFQPTGVHGPSQVIDHSDFKWNDENWNGITLEKMIIYELHTGAFTSDGTFEAIIPKIGYLKELGVNAIELMPVAQFPGRRNWGYDGAYLFAVQNSYGGPDGLKKLVNECHQEEMAVILDVVYNHFGPEGNYLADYGPYFTDKYRTPWGKAINFDDAYCDGVRNYFIRNSLYWFEKYHIDSLRLDAVHGIFDMGARHILEELASEAAEFSKRGKRRNYLIAESDLNNIRIVKPRDAGGYGLDAQWCDDFHHIVHTILTGENQGYYADFGKFEFIAKALKEGFIYSWDYSVYRKKHFGSSSAKVPASKFIAFIQNHDQIGNRMMGDRLSKLVSFDALKLAAGILMVSPYIPLLFMGEEYAEDNPFLYFINHTDEALVKAVREGRKNEFKSFVWNADPPDPQDEATFLSSRLNWSKLDDEKHRAMLEYYKELIRLRKETPALSNLSKADMNVSVFPEKKILLLERWHNESRILAVMNFDAEANKHKMENITGDYKLIFNSADSKWKGDGFSPISFLRSGDEIEFKPYAFYIYEMETDQ